MSLEERVSVLEAREAVRELRARYGWHAARGEYRQISELFTADGVFEFSGLGERQAFRGRQSIRDMLGTTMTPQMVFPFIHNDIIIVNGSEASGTCTMDTNIAPGRDRGLLGYYHDKARSEGGIWLFSERRWFLYHPAYEDSGLGFDGRPREDEGR